MFSRWILLVFLFAGCAAMSNMEELGTLKSMGDEDKQKERELAEEDKNFQKIQAAIREKQLKIGASSEDMARQWGNPVVTAEEPKGRRWVYKEKKGDWFSAAKIYLYFGEDGRLQRWECFKIVCES